jgi:hypothetical protein
LLYLSSAFGKQNIIQNTNNVKVKDDEVIDFQAHIWSDHFADFIKNNGVRVATEFERETVSTKPLSLKKSLKLLSKLELICRFHSLLH